MIVSQNYGGLDDKSKRDECIEASSDPASHPASQMNFYSILPAIEEELYLLFST
jgi:hypothetical protein